MHTFKGPKGTVFLHNGDFSGEVVVANNPKAAAFGNECVIPAEDLLALVASVVAARKIERLEQAEPKDILGL